MKTIAVILPFERFYPPANGGMLRCFHLLRQLCLRFRVLAITYQDSASFEKAKIEYPELSRCQIVSAGSPGTGDQRGSRFARLRDAVLYRWRSRSVSGPTNTHFVHLYPVLNELLRREKIQAILFEEISVIPLAKLSARTDPSIKLIYDAHNVNSNLARIDAEQGRMTAGEYAAVEQTERNIYRYVPDLFACSESDLETLIRMNANRIRGIVVPNGVVIRAREPKLRQDGGKKNRLLFCGSLNYLPNEEGLAWFCEKIFPLILKTRPDVRLNVVGSGIAGDTLKDLLNQPGITNHGFVKDLTPFYDSADIAIVPLLSGSGTRLKLLEAMGYSVAVVSTAIGAEGIGYRDGIDISIANSAEAFAAQITELLSEGSKLEKMAAAGFELVVRKYNWDNIGEAMNSYLDQVTA